VSWSQKKELATMFASGLIKDFGADTLIAGSPIKGQSGRNVDQILGWCNFPATFEANASYKIRVASFSESFAPNFSPAASNACGAITALAPHCVPKVAYGFSFGPSEVGDGGYQQLCHPVAPPYFKRGLAVVYYQDFDFVPIIGVNGAGGVQNRGAMLEGQARPGADLALVTLRYGHHQAGRHEKAVARQQDDRLALWERGHQVQAGGMWGAAGREGQAACMWQLMNLYYHFSVLNWGSCKTLLWERE
jgi:hypothetical protein